MLNLIQIFADIQISPRLSVPVKFTLYHFYYAFPCYYFPLQVFFHIPYIIYSIFSELYDFSLCLNDHFPQISHFLQSYVPHPLPQGGWGLPKHSTRLFADHFLAGHFLLTHSRLPTGDIWEISLHRSANSFLLVFFAVSGPFTSFLVLHTVSWFSRSEVCAFVWGIFVRGLRVETFVRVLRSSRVVL